MYFFNLQIFLDRVLIFIVLLLFYYQTHSLIFRNIFIFIYIFLPFNIAVVCCVLIWRSMLDHYVKTANVVYASLIDLFACIHSAIPGNYSYARQPITCIHHSLTYLHAYNHLSCSQGYN